MTTYRRIISVLWGAAALAAPAHGQDSAERQALGRSYIDQGAGLGLDAAIARALEQELSLRAVRAEVAAARGRREQALSLIHI